MTILPTIVFVPGAWHSPEFFSPVISILERLGYKCITVSMPALDRPEPVDSLDEDIAAVRKVVLKELDAGLDVIMHIHSWGGVPANSALDGLSKAEREQDGKTGAVVKLTFVAAFVLPENTSLLDIVGGVVPDFWDIQEDGNVWPLDAVSKFYHDLEPKQQQYWLSRLKPHSLKESPQYPTFNAAICSVPNMRHVIVEFKFSLFTFTTKTKSAAYKIIPSVYLVCEDDRAIPFQGQDALVSAVKEAGGDIETERLFVSHSVHVVRPRFVAGFIRRAAGEEVPANA